MVHVMLALALAVATPAKAKDCSVALPRCGEEGSIVHTAVGGFGAGGALHGECAICTDNGVPVNPTVCHQCQIELNDGERAAYAKLLNAARVGDVNEIVKLAGAVSKRVVYNRERGTIQIEAACDPATIVASLRLVTEEQRLAALVLRDGAAQTQRVVVGLQ